MPKSSFASTKLSLQVCTLRISLAARQNSTKKYKNCARRKTTNPQVPGCTDTHHPLYLYYIGRLSVKKKIALNRFAAIFFIFVAALSRRKADFGTIRLIFFQLFVLQKKAT